MRLSLGPAGMSGAVTLILTRFEEGAARSLNELNMEMTPDKARHVSRLLARQTDKGDAAASKS